MKEKLYVICILYNKRLKEIRSLDSFLSFPSDRVGLIVADNSTGDFAEENGRVSAEIPGMRFLASEGNLGLSKAYNRAIKTIEDDNYWVMLSDDDTLFSKDYISNVLSAMEEGGADLISGVITAGGNPFSPQKKPLQINRRSNFFTMPGIYENVFCVNTGMVIKKSVLDEIGPFNEELFLDMIDYWFCYELSRKGLNRFKIVGGEILQDFSVQSTEIEKIEARHKIFKKDYRTFCKLTRKSWLYREFGLLKRSLRVFLTKNRLKKKRKANIE